MNLVQKFDRLLDVVISGHSVPDDGTRDDIKGQVYYEIVRSGKVPDANVVALCAERRCLDHLKFTAKRRIVAGTEELTAIAAPERLPFEVPPDWPRQERCALTMAQWGYTVREMTELTGETYSTQRHIVKSMKARLRKLLED